MPAYQYSNFGYSTVAGGAGGIGTPLNAADTTLHVQANDGAWMPSVFPFQLLLGQNQKGSEVAQCTARSGDTLTIVRAQENTSAQTWAVGSSVEVIVSAATMAEAMRNSYQYLYLPAGWDTAWQAAKKASGSTPAVVAAIGDSITAGQNSSDIMGTSWYAKMRAAILAQGYTLGADYYGLLYSSAIGGLSLPNGAPVVVNGTNGTNYAVNYSAYNRMIFSATTALSSLVTCTPPYNVVGFDIIYLDYASGTWSYQVDGGTATTVTTTGPGTGAGCMLKKVSITGLTAGSHTLAINSIGTTANVCNIIGITAYAVQSSGIRFANHGWPGLGLVNGNATHNALADTGQFPPDRLALHQGYQGTTAAPTALSGFGFPAQPDLAIVALGINDASFGTTATQFEDNLRRLIQVLRYGKQDSCSILIIGMYTADNLVQSSTTVPSTDYTAAATAGIQELYDGMRMVAQEYGCAYASVHTMMGRTPASNGWTASATNIHPTDAGYAKIATLIGQVI